MIQWGIEEDGSVLRSENVVEICFSCADDL